jgi:putative tryptophan/tyrosine transport system substrate-binding protein
MRRIGLAILLSVSLVLTPLAVGAQPVARVYAVGLLSIGSPGEDISTTWWQPFLDAMRELNYVPGRNLVVKRVSARGRAERLGDLARDLVQDHIDVIVTTSTRETQAAKQATSTIPIVMTFPPDPVEQGLVASLVRPGGNVTGLTNLVPGLRQKYVELLKEVVPGASRFAVIASPGSLGPAIRRELETGAAQLGVTLSVLTVQRPDEFESALTSAKAAGAEGVIVSADALTLTHRRALVGLVLKHRLPAIYWAREYVEDGGLMTYSANLVDLRRRAATYVEKILRGAKPADLPVEQPTKFEFVINLKTAKALGLTIPQSLLVRADEIIQ